jgi:hypothetical protein
MNPYTDDPDYQERLRRQMLDQLDVTPPGMEPEGNRGTTDPVNGIPTPQPVSTFQPGTGSFTDVTAQKIPLPGTTQPESAPAASTKTGWGYDSPTGGRKEFSYTPQSYGSDMGGFQGFSQQGENSSDPSSIKNIWRDTAMGLGSGPEGFTEAKMDEAIARLNAQGIPARKVDAYQVDFGNGEGPIQVRHSSNQVWWNNRATEGQAPTSQAAQTSTAGMPAPTTTDAGGTDALSAIQRLIQDLLKGDGYSRDAVLSQLKG